MIYVCMYVHMYACMYIYTCTNLYTHVKGQVLVTSRAECNDEHGKVCAGRPQGMARDCRSGAPHEIPQIGVLQCVAVCYRVYCERVDRGLHTK